jgi:hypothetical protein
MYTSLVLFALAAPAADDTLTWVKDYPAARRLSAEKNKPIAVFLGEGKTGYDKVVQGGLTERTRQLLQDNYIPVYINTTTEEGRSLAQQFDMPGGQGIVISSHNGKLQAFSHPGELPNTELNARLQRYADGRYVVNTTETLTTGRTSFYGPDYGTSGPVMGGYQPGYVYPGVSGQPGYGYPGFSGQPGYGYPGGSNYGNYGGGRRGGRRGRY